ncbi:hypothetical protein HPB47_008170 [Ixodes persulcatus]|uniref:Uncharacterized protein n=1 Tax=Ixodes persulcatus TaxID=34615 RepID=A0AC60P5I4_IXOPE|nr:hypothetical protein HPB47_008170 [Ixodes persulcatus]
MSVSYGYTYPPKPDHLPPLNLVEERLIAPRLPFMSIRRLTHGNGQYGIKGQVVNVPINVPTTVQCLPRNIPDDVAIDVHLKRRLVCKPSYKRGLVKKRNIHEWLKHLEHSPLYKYLKIKIDWRRLANVQDDGAVDDDEIEPAPEVTDLEDPMQAVIALNTMAHTLIFDDGACGVDTVAAITAARTAVHSASDDLGLIEGTHSLHVAPGEGQTPISLLFDDKEFKFEALGDRSESVYTKLSKPAYKAGVRDPFRLLHHAADDEVRAAPAPCGTVTEVGIEKWRTQGFEGCASMTRMAVSRLKPGLTLDNQPHQLRIAGGLALDVAPGSTPLCLRCQGTGHIRRDCRVPKCFRGGETNIEHIMDEEDKEDAEKVAGAGYGPTGSKSEEEENGMGQSSGRGSRMVGDGMVKDKVLPPDRPTVIQ